MHLSDRNERKGYNPWKIKGGNCPAIESYKLYSFMSKFSRSFSENN